MWETRERVKELLRESAYTQKRLAELIVKKYGYRFHPTLLCAALRGKMDTPKARRVLTDALSLLLVEKRRRDRLMTKGEEK